MQRSWLSPSPSAPYQPRLIDDDSLVFDWVANQYRDKVTGRLTPGIVEILEVAGFIRPGVRTDTGHKRGLAVRDAIKNLEEKQTPFDQIKDPVVKSYVLSYLRWKEKSGFVAWAVEKVIYHPFYGYAGNLGAWGVIRGREVVLVIKAGPKENSWGLELAAQNACLPSPPLGFRSRLALRLSLTGERARAVPHTDVRDEPTFFGAAYGYHWKAQAGLIKPPIWIDQGPKEGGR